MPIVLIVDDDVAMREALGEASADLGFDARLAPTGAAALALLEEETVDAVLLDLRMPGLDGLEVLRRLRGRPTSPPVAVLTAHASAENTIEAMRLGAFDHLTKPISRDDLRRALTGMAAVDFILEAGPSRTETLDWPDEDIPSAIERLEKLLIGRALVRSQGNRAEAARRLGIHRQLLYAKIKRFRLEASAERTEGVGKTDASGD